MHRVSPPCQVASNCKWSVTWSCWGSYSQHPVQLSLLGCWCIWRFGALRICKNNVDDKRKLLSICQDVMYMSNKGKVIFPKHSSLAMTVRHMTGSAKLIGILNGLGHCSSHSMVLEHDTALATKQLSKGDDMLPEGVSPKFTMLVWDNIDFSEETLSGKGTTHSTNGILIQTGKPEVQHEQHPSLPRSHKWSISAPTSSLVSYFRTVKKGPAPCGQDIDIRESQDDLNLVSAKKKDLAFHLSRLPRRHGCLLPSWTGYNTQLDDSKPKISSIYYLPAIDASPTMMDTVNTILVKSVRICTLLQQESIVIVCDQAIYSKVQQIQWKDAHLMARTVIRMGEFHTGMNFLAFFGKRFRDAGLQDIVIVSGLVAEGSTNTVLTGHQYNRSLRMHKIVSEAMEHMRWQAFLKTLSEEEQEQASDLMKKLQDSFPSDEHKQIVSGEQFDGLQSKYTTFVINQSTSPTFAFWSSYIDMVEQLLLFIRATKEGDWKLHLASVRGLMPWFFTYDHFNYSRYLPVYWSEMKRGSPKLTHQSMLHFKRGSSLWIIRTTMDLQGLLETRLLNKQ